MRYLIPMSLLSLAFTYAAVAKPTYIVSGRSVPTEQAIMASLRGNAVLKCVEVEAKPSTTGTSIGLKAKK